MSEPLAATRSNDGSFTVVIPGSGTGGTMTVTVSPDGSLATIGTRKITRAVKNQIRTSLRKAGNEGKAVADKV